jgi:hypothetical protein
MYQNSNLEDTHLMCHSPGVSLGMCYIKVQTSCVCDSLFYQHSDGWELQYHLMLMNWAMAFLARTSTSTYNKVAKVMMLPNIGTVYWEMAEPITTKAYCLHTITIRSISDRARCKNWTSHQWIGVIDQDFANINSRIEYDYVTNTLKGGN